MLASSTVTNVPNVRLRVFSHIPARFVAEHINIWGVSRCGHIDSKTIQPSHKLPCIPHVEVRGLRSGDSSGQETADSGTASCVDRCVWRAYRHAGSAFAVGLSEAYLPTGPEIHVPKIPRTLHLSAVHLK
jgi:hypothetical protein